MAKGEEPPKKKARVSAADEHAPAAKPSEPMEVDLTLESDSGEPEDNDDVVITEPAPADAAGGGGGDDDDDDDDDDDELKIVGESGFVALRDMPHERATCCQFTFVPTPADPSHVQYCKNCYCYVCDKPASECKSWGDGKNPKDHCHAHARSSSWQAARQMARNGGRVSTSVASGAGRGTHYGGSGSISLSGLVPPSSSVPPQPAPRIDPNTVDYSEELPDPTTNPALIELGTIELPFEIKSKHTVREIAPRLSKTGFVYAHQNDQSGNRPHTSKFPLSYLVGYRPYTGNNVPELEWLPLPPPNGAEAPEGPPDKVPKFVFVMPRAGEPAIPQVKVVQVERNGSVGAFRRKVRDLLEPSLGEKEVLALATVQSGSLVGWLLNDSTRLNVAVRENYDIFAYRHAVSSKDAAQADRTASSHSQPECVVIEQAKLVPGPPLTAKEIRRRQIRFGYGNSAALQSDPTTKRFGFPLVLPVPKCGVNGGKPARKFIKNLARQMLKPYWLDGDTETSKWKAKVVKRSDLYGYSSYYGPRTALEDKSRLFGNASSRVGYYGSANSTSTVTRAMMEWLPVGAAPSLKCQEMDKAATLDTSVAEIKAALDEQKRVRDLEKANHAASQEPKNIVSEIHRTTGAPDVQAVNRGYSHSRPYMRVNTTIHEDPTKGPEFGFLRAQLFCLRQSTDNWISSGPMTGNELRPMLTNHMPQSHSRYSRDYDSIVPCVINRLFLQAQGGDAFDIWKTQYSNFKYESKEGRINLKGVVDACETGERSAAQQPAGLSVSMHNYQKQSLAFMYEQERRDGGFRSLFWRNITLPGGSKLWHSPMLNCTTLNVPETNNGGFICEEMGMGKTIEVLGLILGNPARSLPAAQTGQPVPSTATLVVCAVSLVGQWMEEARQKLGDDSKLRMHMYHGGSRIRNAKILARDFDLVVTTYSTMAADFSRDKEKAPLHSVKWHRVVLDESHTVKGTTSVQSKASVALTSQFRWCCTGTPVNTSIEDLMGQFDFLGLEPFGRKPIFDTFFKHKFGADGYANESSVRMLLWLMKQITVRHTKQQQFGGAELVRLPEKDEEQIAVTLTAAERKKYDELEKTTKSSFEGFRKLGPSHVSSNILQIMSILLPLRRICSGGALSKNDVSVPQRGRGSAHGSSHNAAGGSGSGSGSGGSSAHQPLPPPDVKPGAGVVGAGGSNAPAPRPVDVKPGAAGSSSIANQASAATSTPRGSSSLAPPPPATPCGICEDLVDNPAFVRCCQSWFCLDCIQGRIENTPKCPTCQDTCTAAHLQMPAAASTAPPPPATSAPAAAPAAPTAQQQRAAGRGSGNGGDDDDNDDDDDDYAPAAAKEKGKGKAPAVSKPTSSTEIVSESKLQVLLKELAKMREKDSTSKALVFSQFASTLEWMKTRLTEEGFSYRTITGSMPLKQRDKAIQAFLKDPPTTVFLLSMRSGAVGINLTSADHVFLLEPCFNPALEAQAIGRAWRMGQQREVHVKRLYVTNSVEERILKVVKSRQEQNVGQNKEFDALMQKQGRGKAKITGTDIAGALKQDKQNLRLEELEVLFGLKDDMEEDNDGEE